MRHTGWWIGLVALAVLCALQAAQAQAPKAREFPITVVDALNRKVTITRKPARIVSLAPNVTEILFALGAGKRVVADTTYCDYPAAAARLPKVGGYSNPDAEKIITFAPDLVLGARGNPQELYKQLDTARIPAVSVEAVSVQEMLDTIRLVGNLVGERAAAAKLIKSLDARRQAVKKATATLPEAKRPRVLFLFTPDTLYSAGTGSFIDELITLGGGRNIAAKTKTPWPELSMEAVLADNPQVIMVLAFSMGDARKPLTSAEALKRFRKQSRWQSVSAVKTGRVYAVDDDCLTLPGPRLIDGLEATARALHPALFRKGAR